MNIDQDQIVTAFEVARMNPQQIAEAFDLDQVAVKSTLMQCSSQYRKEAKNDPTLQYTFDEAKEMSDIIAGIARHSEDEGLQLKAAIFVYNEFKGRNEAAANKQAENTTFNVTQINVNMQRALQAESRTLLKAVNKTLDDRILPASICNATD